MYKILYAIAFTGFISLVSCTEDPRCNDGLWNGDETSVDCGGNCDPCFSCTDGILNQNEIEVDCGGSCPPCANLFEWETLESPSPQLRDIHFFNGQEGIILTQTEIWRTMDSGNNFEQIAAPGGIYNFHWMEVVHRNLAYVVVGQNPAGRYRIYQVTNDFNTWTEFGLNLDMENTDFGSVFDIVAPDDNTIVVAHDHKFGQIYISRSRDAGQSWEVIFDSFDVLNGNTDYYAELQYVDGSIHFFQDRKYFVSYDDGANWDEKELPFEVRVFPREGAVSFRKMFFTSPNEAIYYGGQRVFTTVDAGDTWLERDPVRIDFSQFRIQYETTGSNNTRIAMTRVSCSNENEGVCSIAWQSDDNGVSWELLGYTDLPNDSRWEELQPTKCIYFPGEAIWAIDASSWNENRKLLYLKL